MTKIVVKTHNINNKQNNPVVEYLTIIRRVARTPSIRDYKRLLLLLLQTTNLACRKQSFKDRLQKLHFYILHFNFTYFLITSYAVWLTTKSIKYQFLLYYLCQGWYLKQKIYLFTYLYFCDLFFCTVILCQVLEVGNMKARQVYICGKQVLKLFTNVFCFKLSKVVTWDNANSVTKFAQTLVLHLLQ